MDPVLSIVNYSTKVLVALSRLWTCSDFGCGLWFTMSNYTFNNISVISWQSFLLVEETGVPGDTLSHNVVSSTPHPRGIQTHNVSGDRHLIA